jgi:hypothetical protein
MTLSEKIPNSHSSRPVLADPFNSTPKGEAVPRVDRSGDFSHVASGMTQKPDQWFDSSVIFRVFRPTPRAARKRANEFMVPTRERLAGTGTKDECNADVALQMGNFLHGLRRLVTPYKGVTVSKILESARSHKRMSRQRSCIGVSSNFLIQFLHRYQA